MYLAFIFYGTQTRSTCKKNLSNKSSNLIVGEDKNVNTVMGGKDMSHSDLIQLNVVTKSLISSWVGGRVEDAATLCWCH